jgi:tetratricopeptide (TPR) repeat protein
MSQSICRFAARVGLAFLALIPIPSAYSAGLREEAVGYRSQGYEAQQRGDAATARQLYQKAAALDPSYATPHNDLGILLEEAGQLPAAEQEYLAALSLNPNYLEAHANLALLYERLGQREKAIVHWMKRYELGDPYDPWTNRAEERLLALGILKTHPGVKGKLFSRRKLMHDEMKKHAQSLEEFHAVTTEHGNWP